MYLSNQKQQQPTGGVVRVTGNYLNGVNLSTKL